MRTEENATARNLWTCARRLMEVLGVDDVLQLYTRHREVEAWIDGDDAPPAAASKMTFYSGLAALANPDKMRAVAAHVPASARERYLGRASALGKAVREEAARNLLDPRERVAIMPWPGIVSAYRRQAGRLNDSQAIIAALYLAGGDNPAGSPRRLDYNAVRVFRGRAPQRVPRTSTTSSCGRPPTWSSCCRSSRRASTTAPTARACPPPSPACCTRRCSGGCGSG